MALIKCPDCGKEFSEYAECCPECGCPVDAAKESNVEKKPQEETANEVSTPQSTIFNEPQQIQQPQRKKPLGLIVAIVILSLVVVGLVATFVVMKYFDNSDHETASTEILQSGSEDGNNQPSYSDYETRYDYVCNRYVRDSDLIGVSKEELRIMRNWIFARHGYIFKSKDLQEYFGQFSWYHPRYADVTSMLSDIEITNIDFIKRYE